ncbi:MAG: hypothetical protein JXM79_04240, partial [Sedimentisphaerales bacterium]|nr:hypothetical protein [Sedimentisphaerales bacterium]
QGAGVYAKVYPIDFNDASVKTYARESQILMDFFDSLKDYVALKPGRIRISQGPGKYRLTMASGKEIVVYLHKGLGGKNTKTDEQLVLEDLPLKDGEVSLMLLHPTTGKKENKILTVRNNSLSISLSEFCEDIAIHVLQH